MTVKINKKQKIGIGIAATVLVCGIALSSVLSQSNETDSTESTTTQTSSDSSSSSNTNGIVKRDESSTGNSGIVGQRDTTNSSDIVTPVVPQTRNNTTRQIEDERYRALGNVQQLANTQEEQQQQQQDEEKNTQPEKPVTPVTPILPELPEEPVNPVTPEPPVVSVDYSLLATAVTQALTVDLNEYLSSSISVFTYELANAQSMLSQRDSTQYVVNQQIIRLQAAQSNLIRKGDKTTLQVVSSRLGALDLELYSEETAKVLDNCLQEAYSLLSREEVGQQVLDSMVTTLEEAEKGLVFKTDYELAILFLTRTVSEAEKLVSEDYTPQSFDNVSTALLEAKGLLDNDEATVEELTAANETLKLAISELVLRADFTALLEKIAEIESMDSSLYTTTSWQPVETALEKGKEIAADFNSSQEVVDEYLTTINSAVEGLQERAETALLEAKISEVEMMDSSLYTTVSWSNVAAALSEAKAGVTDENATQADVESLLSALNEAVAALELIESEQEETIPEVDLEQEETPTDTEQPLIPDGTKNSNEENVTDSISPTSNVIL